MRIGNYYSNGCSQRRIIKFVFNKIKMYVLKILNKRNDDENINTNSYLRSLKLKINSEVKI